MRRRQPRTWRSVVASGGIVLAVASCAGEGDQSAIPESETAAARGVEGEITVFAAASLSEAYTQIGEDFEAANPDTTVQFNFAGSSSLAQQITSGAPADVFASANEGQMQVVVDAGLAGGQPTLFAQNTLQIAVPEGNPANVEEVAAFGDPDLTIAICAEEVPCGVAAQTVFDVAGVDAAPDTLERDVKAVLTKVSLGEADAGLVYVTDVASAGGDVEGVDFPEADEAVNDYPLTVLTEAPNAKAASAFTDYVLSEDGRAVLQEYGFITDVS